jgi:hypothetical protein
MSWLNDLLVPVAFKPKRRIGSFYATVTLEETGTDEMEITQHPVQYGAAITDHAYKQPVTLSINCQSKRASTGVSVAEMYRKLRELQSSAIPMDVVTGKRIYKNMLIKTLSETTDNATGDILNVSLSLTEVILVGVVTVEVPDAELQANPEQTNATEKTGTKQATQPSEAVATPVKAEAANQSILSRAFG